MKNDYIYSLDCSFADHSDRDPIFENLIDRVQLARKLRLSPSYISKMMADEGLPHYKIGRSVRYKLSEVAAFLNERRMP